MRRIRTYQCFVLDASGVDKPLLAGTEDDWLLGSPVVRIAVGDFLPMQNLFPHQRENWHETWKENKSEPWMDNLTKIAPGNSPVLLPSSRTYFEAKEDPASAVNTPSLSTKLSCKRDIYVQFGWQPQNHTTMKCSLPGWWCKLKFRSSKQKIILPSFRAKKTEKNIYRLITKLILTE